MLVDSFGDKVFETIESESGRELICTLKGFGPKLIQNVLPSYEEAKKFKDIYIFLNGVGTKNQINKIYEKYGKDSLNVIKKNPYRLIMDIDGFGFLKIDTLALASGVKPDSMFRMMAAAKHVLEEAQGDGNCYLPIETLKELAVLKMAPVPTFKDLSSKVADNAVNSADWLKAKEALIKEHNPSYETLSKLADIHGTRKLLAERFPDAVAQAITEKTLYNDDGCIYTPAMYSHETQAANLIKEMCSKKTVRYISKENIDGCIAEMEKAKTEENFRNGKHEHFEISPEQRKAVYLGLMNRLSIISGGPGRGKTTIVQAIASTFIKSGRSKSNDDVLVLAPTGRAAQRVTESTGYPASTVHRAIYKVQKRADKGVSFIPKSEEERPKDILIICDESSMLDIKLAKDLLAYASDCNLIFVGDADQIPSVGPGRVLRDMLAAGTVPGILLKEGHRNSGSIAHNADLINAGQKISHYCYDEHFVYTATNADNMLEDIAKDYLEKIKEYGIENVLLCTPMRDRGSAAVNKLNKYMQEKLTYSNPFVKCSDAKTLHTGDRVMQTRNNYEMIARDKNGNIKEGIFNGEKGTIIDILNGEDASLAVIKVLFDDGSVAIYESGDFGDIVLAYATTLHKCQGSEAACAMICMSYGDYMLMNKELFYTGVTRAKKECRLYGEEQERYGHMLSAFDMAVKKTDSVQRYTKLAERLSNV